MNYVLPLQCSAVIGLLKHSLFTVLFVETIKKERAETPTLKLMLMPKTKNESQFMKLIMPP